MIPNFEFLGRTVSPYMIAALLGIFSVMYVTKRLALKRGLDEIHTLYMTLWSFLGVFLGGHILYGITNVRYIIILLSDLSLISSFNDLIKYFVAIFGGSVFYGGLLGMLLVNYIYLKTNKIQDRSYYDVVGVAIPLFHFFGRLGCFLSGCCYGIPWEHGIVYRFSEIAIANGIPRFPVQLVEALLNLGLFIALLVLYIKGKKNILSIYLFTYPVYRFILEFFRGDEYRGFLLGLSTSQWISVLIILVMIIYMLKAKKRKPY